MEIFYLSNSVFPSQNANSVQVINTCAALANEGNKVELFARYSNEIKFVSNIDIFRNYGIENIFEINLFKWPNIRLIGGYIYSFFAYLSIKKKPLPDVFYGRDPNTILKVLSFNKPTFLEVHTIPTDSYKCKIIKKILQNKNFIKLIVTSDALKISYLKLFPFLKDSNICVVRNAAKINNIIAMRKEFIQHKFPVVGYVGSLKEGKGISLICEIAHRMPNIQFIIIGGTEKQIAQINLKLDIQNVLLKGFIESSKLSDMFNNFDILIAPYQNIMITSNFNNSNVITDKFASPLKVIEYMSYKKAIIASDLPMIREVLINNETALLCDPNNIDEWVDAINLLYNNSELYKKISNNSYNEFINNYTWESRAKRIIEIINNNFAENETISIENNL